MYLYCVCFFSRDWELIFNYIDNEFSSSGFKRMSHTNHIAEVVIHAASICLQKKDLPPKCIWGTCRLVNAIASIPPQSAGRLRCEADKPLPRGSITELPAGTQGAMAFCSRCPKKPQSTLAEAISATIKCISSDSDA